MNFRSPEDIPFWFFWLCFFVIDVWSIFSAGSKNGCGSGRKIYSSKNGLNLLFGTIMNVQNETTCEWLIQAEPRQSINLNFSWINFTCHAETLYLFDGDSFEDLLLARINGPFRSVEPVYSTSGSLLLVYQSDSSGVPTTSRPTFSIEFSITDCPHNCSGHGTCVEDRCICHQHRAGEACQFDLCPNNCSKKYGHCVQSSVKDVCSMESEYFCDCDHDIIGQSCNVHLGPDPEGDPNPKLELKPLFSNENLFSARASHASVYDETTDRIYTYGGRNHEYVHGDLIAFSIATNQWFNLTSCDISGSQVRPKPLWAHTMNIAMDGSLILFGGISNDGIFSNELWVHGPLNVWMKKEPDKLSEIPPGLAFHTATIVDHKWLYVHGGYMENFTYSSNLYRIDFHNNLSHWELILPVNGKPYHRQIAAHTSAFYGPLRSIVFYAGISWSWNEQKSIFRQEIHLYHVDKNTWSTLSPDTPFEQNFLTPMPRAFHSMVLFEDSFLIFGGSTQGSNSSNKCNDDQLYVYDISCHQWHEFFIPTDLEHLASHTIVKRKGLIFILGGYRHRVSNAMMALPLPIVSDQHSKCESLCPRLKTCFECLAYDFCSWNHRTFKCNDDILNSSDYLKQQSQCRKHIHRSGFTFLQYQHPANFSYPDDVSIQPPTSFEPNDIEPTSCTDNCSLVGHRDWNLARILGFIHPLSTHSFNDNIRIYIRSKSPHILYSSNGSGPSFRQYDSYVDLSPDPFNNYFVDFLLKFPIKTVMDKLDYEKIEIFWKVHSNVSQDLVLEPFGDEKVCQEQTTCLSCLANVACAWCPSTDRCMIRADHSGCHNRTSLLDPEDCFRCYEVNNCERCVSDVNCEWLENNAVCIRRGRFNDSIRSVKLCPIECHHRVSCETCLAGNQDCIWCDPNQCLPNALYYPSSMSKYCLRKKDHFQCISERPKPKCDLGWTGTDCTVDCGCYHHSTCQNGVGICDHCRFNTAGPHCNVCATGSFGNGTDPRGCTPCNCNGHGDPSRGLCHPQTGVCFCQHHTEGSHCDRCPTGYYGDPKNGGHCYLECQTKTLVANVTAGYFGSYIRDIHFSKHYSHKTTYSSIANIYCLWIFTTGSSIPYHYPDFPGSSASGPIQITIFGSHNLNCSHSTLMVYDGIPELISNGNNSKYNLLASFCGSDHQQDDIQLVASYGIATVLFISDDFHQGFNGSYQHIMEVSTQNKVDDSITGQSAFWPQHSHTLEYYKDSLIFVGGHLDSKHLPLTIFSLEHRHWILPEVKPKARLPSNRFLHTSAMLKDKLYVYGGSIGWSNQVSNEFWCAIIHQESFSFVWINLTLNETMPALAGHSLTPIEFDNQPALILLGGFSPDDGFNQHQFIYYSLVNQWHLLKTKGPSPVGIVAHTVQYMAEANSIYVFGGIDFKESHKMAVSNTLYRLDLNGRVWHRVQASVNHQLFVPPIYLHHSVSFNNYLLIFGGRKHFNIYSEDFSIYAYIFRCNRWVTLNKVSLWNDSTGTSSNRLTSIKSSTFHDGVIYFFETSVSTSPQTWLINRIKFPLDFCNLFNDDRGRCLSFEGCSFCASADPPVCFDNHNVPTTLQQDCDSIVHGETCSPVLDCNRFTNCADCTANNYEVRNDGGCQWCADCHFANGQCIKMNDTCHWDNYDDVDDDRDLELTGHERIICANVSLIETERCPSRRCLATDCHKCTPWNDDSGAEHKENRCIWTKQVYKFIRFGHPMPMNPIFDWACTESSILRFAVMKNVPTIPPLECPARCNKHVTCASCLEETTGDESGSHECVWNDLSHECMSPTYAMLRCQYEYCGGSIYQRTVSQCPNECETYDRAADCLSLLQCGWCSINGFPIDGVGFCLRGGLFGPLTVMACSNLSVDLLARLAHKPYYVPPAFFRAEWHYLSPPKENECLNGHHTCDETSQDCLDLEEGFMCRCKNGYKMFENVCKPICQRGCTHGVCIAPNTCRCNFGFIGEDCSIECQCHGHSTCPSAERSDECIKCHNNTQGKWCEKCQPFFVGNPSMSGGSCQPCFEYCHNHSNLCFGEELLANSTLDLDDDHWYRFGLITTKQGSDSKTVCVNCKNNTEGERCDRCKLGFFRISDHIRDGCRPCMCNGHGTVCNPFNGESCDCHNNTENDRQCNYLNSKEYSNYINKTYFFKSSQIMTTYSLPCWMLQCSKCKDYFYGIPTGGHQCYRHMYLDKEYCLDPHSQDNCPHRPQPLLNGRAICFGLQPRYMNVDIKLIVYSVEGRLDLFLASKDDIFVVKVDPTNGFHRIFVDRKYSSPLDVNVSRLNQNDSIGNTEDHPGQELGVLDLAEKLRLKSPYKLHITNLNGKISSYFTMKNWNEIVILRNIRNRLEITIPYKTHDLRTTRYYMIIKGNDLFDSDTNFGFVVLRQDQSRIDLFIFFCVFLACFFLFLCFTIMFWRFKQIVDLHRARHQQEIELEQMANRPFTKITLLMDEFFDEPAFHKASMVCRSLQGTPSKKRYFLRNWTIHGFKEPPKIYPADPLATLSHEQRRPSSTARPMPIAIEPTVDGLAAIVTILVRLPGESASIIPISAASALVSMKNSPSLLVKLNANAATANAVK